MVPRFSVDNKIQFIKFKEAAPLTFVINHPHSEVKSYDVIFSRSACSFKHCDDLILAEGIRGTSKVTMAPTLLAQPMINMFTYEYQLIPS